MPKQLTTNFLLSAAISFSLKNLWTVLERQQMKQLEVGPYFPSAPYHPTQNGSCSGNTRHSKLLSKC